MSTMRRLEKAERLGVIALMVANYTDLKWVRGKLELLKAHNKAFLSFAMTGEQIYRQKMDRISQLLDDYPPLPKDILSE